MTTTQLIDWIGKSETTTDSATATPYAALSALLDLPDIERPSNGVPLPALWHWLYFLPLHRQSDIGPDGHGRRGGFMPPVALPRRMWAGSQFLFHRPLRVGDRLTRRSTIEGVNEKSGRSGPLVFVRVRHELSVDAGPDAALVEWHDIVYRGAARADDVAPAPIAAPTPCQWQRTITPDEVLLFRYSALTLNGHRIHYDRSYVTQTEGYPGLVVHGPLIATLLLDLLRRHLPDADLSGFEFKALRAVFDGRPLTLSAQTQGDGSTVHLWATDHEGWLAMDAQARLRGPA
jgi:3-methylfumaryl-CoA hydratase